MEPERTKDDIINELEAEESGYSKYKHSLTKNWLRAACLYLIVASVIGIVPSIGWLSDLCAHFKIHFLMAAAICLILTIWKRMPVFIVVSFAAVLINGYFVSPYLVTTRPDKAKGHPVIRLVHSNVNSQNNQFEDILKVLTESKPDLIAVSELNPRLDLFLREKLVDYPHRISQARKDNFGIGLYSKMELFDPRIVTTDPNIVPPSIEATIGPGKDKTVIYYTHPFPPIIPQTLALRDRQLGEISKRAQEVNGPFILAGDLNTTSWTEGFRRLESEGGLANAEKFFGVQPTWPSNMLFAQLALDHVLTKGDIEVAELYAVDMPGSDHKVLEIVIRYLEHTK